MATALERYQLYVSHVGDETRSFFASLDAQPEEHVRSMLDRKGFGRRTYLVLTWIDFRNQMRREADNEETLRRINRSIEAGERAADLKPPGPADVKVTLPPRNSALAFMSGLKNFLMRR